MKKPTKKPAAPAVPDITSTLNKFAAHLGKTREEMLEQFTDIAQKLAALEQLLRESKPAKERKPREAKAEPAEKSFSHGACPDCGENMTRENSSTSPHGRVTHIGCPGASKPAPAAEPEAKPVAVEDLRLAAAAYAKKHGRDSLVKLLEGAGYKNLNEIPEEDRAPALEALRG